MLCVLSSSNHSWEEQLPAVPNVGDCVKKVIKDKKRIFYVHKRTFVFDDRDYAIVVLDIKHTKPKGVLH